MNKEDLDALAGLYEGVYSPAKNTIQSNGEVLCERVDPNKDIGARMGNAIVNTLRDVGTGTVKDIKNLATTGRLQDTPERQRIRKGVDNFTKAAQRTLSGNRPKTATPPASRPPAATPPAATPPAARPSAARPSAATPPAARPSASSAKVAPTAAAKPSGQTGDKAKDMATWAKANPTLANKPKTANPLLQDNEISKMKAASVMRQNNMSLPGAKNPTSSDISMSQQKAKADSIVKSGAVAALKPTSPTTPKKPMTQTQSFEWPSAKTINNLADAYSSIYEAKKKDQDQDGDNDFADVQIARMIASGMSKAEAIAAVRNKEYNEEYELDEATRMRKELGKEGETRVRGELAARSKAYKRSGSVDKTIAAAERGADNPYVKFNRNESDDDRKKREEKQKRTLRGLAASRRKSVRSGEGLRGYAAKVEGGDKDLQSARGAARSAGTLTPAERKQLGEVYEIVASYLLENNFAETIDSVNVIIENMSGTWIEQILSEVY